VSIPSSAARLHKNDKRSSGDARVQRALVGKTCILESFWMSRMCGRSSDGALALRQKTLLPKGHRSSFSLPVLSQPDLFTC
jgi:hypothetical protein